MVESNLWWWPQNVPQQHLSAGGHEDLNFGLAARPELIAFHVQIMAGLQVARALFRRAEGARELQRRAGGDFAHRYAVPCGTSRSRRGDRATRTLVKSMSATTGNQSTRSHGLGVRAFANTPRPQ